MSRSLVSKAFVAVVLALSLLAFTPSFSLAAGSAKKYQVTGKVLEVSDKLIVVQTTKGDERWEIERTADTKITGELKVGAKVTIEYRMIATNAEVKADK